jgi:hypothetical protein
MRRTWGEDRLHYMLTLKTALDRLSQDRPRKTCSVPVHVYTVVALHLHFQDAIALIPIVRSVLRSGLAGGACPA